MKRAVLKTRTEDERNSWQLPATRSTSQRTIGLGKDFSVTNFFRCFICSLLLNILEIYYLFSKIFYSFFQNIYLPYYINLFTVHNSCTREVIKMRVDYFWTQVPKFYEQKSFNRYVLPEFEFGSEFIEVRTQMNVLRCYG